MCVDEDSTTKDTSLVYVFISLIHTNISFLLMILTIFNNINNYNCFCAFVNMYFFLSMFDRSVVNLRMTRGRSEHLVLFNK